MSLDLSLTLLNADIAVGLVIYLASVSIEQRQHALYCIAYFISFDVSVMSGRMHVHDVYVCFLLWPWCSLFFALLSALPSHALPPGVIPDCDYVHRTADGFSSPAVVRSECTAHTVWCEVPSSQAKYRTFSLSPLGDCGNVSLCGSWRASRYYVPLRHRTLQEVNCGPSMASW